MRRRSLLTICAACVAACGCTAPDSERRRLDGDGPINFVDGADTSYGAQVRVLVKKWSDEHEGSHVTFTEQEPNPDGLRSQLVAQAQDRAHAELRGLPPGTCYDVMMLDVIWTAEFARAGLIVPLDGYFDTRGFLPRALASATVDGRLWALPLRTDAGLLYYRRDILDAEGLSYPRSFEQLAAQARTVAPRHGINGYVGQFDRYEGFTVNVLEAMWAAAGGQTTDLRRLLGSPAARTGIEMLAGGFRDEWIPGEAIGFDEEPSRAMFQGGQALFLRNWPYVYRRLAADPAMAGRFATAPLPGPSALGGWNLAINRCCTNRRTAREFMGFLTSEESQTVLFDAAGFAPVLTRTYDDPRLRARHPYLAQLKSALKLARIRPVTGYYSQVTSAIQERLHPLLTNPTAVDAVLSALRDDIDRAMSGR